MIYEEVIEQGNYRTIIRAERHGQDLVIEDILTGTNKISGNCMRISIKTIRAWVKELDKEKERLAGRKKK